MTPLADGRAFALGVAGVARLEGAGGVRIPRALAALGDASFSLYLLHVAIIAATLRLLAKLGVDQMIGREALYGVVFVATIGGGLACYRWIERPLITWLRRRLPFDRPRAIQA